MTIPTIDSVVEKIDEVVSDIDELKINKVDKEILELRLEAIRSDITRLQLNMSSINGYGKWLILLILGAVVTAVLKLVVRS
jgi:hypothetical protein